MGLYYKCILAIASVINYHCKHDATIWSITTEAIFLVVCDPSMKELWVT